MELADIRQEILKIFPVGSEWYDCAQDSVGKVEYHFEPRGILLRWTNGDLVQYGYGGLLCGRLIVPRDGGYFHEYREERKRVDEEYVKLVGGQDAWS